MTDAGTVEATVGGGALWVRINRPEKRNALSRGILAELRHAFDAHADIETLRVAVLTSAGDKNFAAGGDLRELSAIRTSQAAAQFSEESRQALDSIRQFPVPVIAAINGDALGGGAELCVACDLRVLASHAGIGFIQGRLKITTAWGGGPDLMRLLGFSRALAVLCRSDRIAALDALSYGLADAVCPVDEPFAAFVDRFVEPMRQQSPLVMRAFKAQALLERFGESRESRRRFETDYFSRSWVHADHWLAVDRLRRSAE
jgi:enoyl-CoA hydratase